MAKKRQQKKFQKELRESAHKVWLAGLGALSAAGEEGSKFFNQLVERGEDFESRGRENLGKAKGEVESSAKKARKEIEGRLDEAWGKMDERLTEAMHRFGVPTRDEIQTLTRRVEELNTKIDQMKNGGGTAAVERKVYHVSSHEDGWKVELEGAANPTSVHGTKDEAVSAAREVAHNHTPSQVIVHKKDGKFQTEYTYDAN